jgi:hypothetical protein
MATCCCHSDLVRSTAVALKSEKAQGAGDDTAATNMKTRCGYKDGSGQRWKEPGGPGMPAGLSALPFRMSNDAAGLLACLCLQLGVGVR